MGFDAMSELIEREELANWIKCKQRAKQIRWLNENGITYRLDAEGYPITTKTAVNASLMQEDNDKVAF